MKWKKKEEVRSSKYTDEMKEGMSRSKKRVWLWLSRVRLIVSVVYTSSSYEYSFGVWMRQKGRMNERFVVDELVFLRRLNVSVEQQ